jgi:hypothetical protein
MGLPSIIPEQYVYDTPPDAEPAFGQWGVRIKWCEKHCEGRWRYAGKGVFHFNLKSDYLTFLLRWA